MKIWYTATWSRRSTYGPWLSMHLEAERRGAEEATLLLIFREVDPEAHDVLIGQVFRAFDDYDNGPDKIEHIYEALLKRLS